LRLEIIELNTHIGEEYVVTFRKALICALVICLALFAGCKSQPGSDSAASNSSQPKTPAQQRIAGPLPDSGFRAAITVATPPEKLSPGQVAVINIKVKNTSDVIWWQRGGLTNDRTDNKFYIAAGNQWLDKDGKKTSETEGHNGIPKDLKPGEETEMTLQITAPKQPGEWYIDLDMLQEGVSWFHEKGSPTTKVKVQVVPSP
jgi:hypothetical protein